jgi:hypothetical protein
MCAFSCSSSFHISRAVLLVFCHLRLAEFRITLGHLDVRVTKDFGQLVQIAAVHHVPGREGVAQIMKPEVLDFRSFEQILKTPFQSLPTTLCTRFGGRILSLSLAAFARCATTENSCSSQASCEGIGTYRILPPFSFALTASKPSPYITSVHRSPNISDDRIPVVTAISTITLRRWAVLFRSFVPFRYFFSSSARFSLPSSSSDRYTDLFLSGCSRVSPQLTVTK